VSSAHKGTAPIKRATDSPANTGRVIVLLHIHQYSFNPFTMPSWIFLRNELVAERKHRHKCRTDTWNIDREPGFPLIDGQIAKSVDRDAIENLG
jgi:hypothetical protein